jgi:hypothetical protein
MMSLLSIGVNEVLDRSVAGRKEQALVPGIPPTNDVWRAAVNASDLDHLTIAIGFTHTMAFDDDAVSDTRVHIVLP